MIKFSNLKNKVLPDLFSYNLDSENVSHLSGTLGFQSRPSSSWLWSNCWGMWTSEEHRECTCMDDGTLEYEHVAYAWNVFYIFPLYYLNFHWSKKDCVFILYGQLRVNNLVFLLFSIAFLTKEYWKQTMQLTFIKICLATLESLLLATVVMFIPNLCFLSIQMHFDDAYGAYFDFGNHTEKVRGPINNVYCCKINNTRVPCSWLRLRFSLHA
jgi:hypothetical protein